MLFFSNRVLLAVMIAFSFLQSTFALPNPQILHAEHTPRASQEIHHMGLSRDGVKEMHGWHHQQVIHAMQNHPALRGHAQYAVIHHTAHQRGTDPNEHNHITAQFFDHHKQLIPNNFNGGPNHHIYVPSSNNGLSKEGRKALERNNVALRQH